MIVDIKGNRLLCCRDVLRNYLRSGFIYIKRCRTCLSRVGSAGNEMMRKFNYWKLLKGILIIPSTALILIVTAFLLINKGPAGPDHTGPSDKGSKNINWNLWRGPDGNGISPETDWDTEFLKKPLIRGSPVHHGA